MNEHPAINGDLVELLLKYTAFPGYLVTGETDIRADLGLDGDDAIEFLMAYGRKFNVGLTNFPAADYFDAEGLQFVYGFLERLGIKTEKKLKSLLVADLQNGINAGYLV